MAILQRFISKGCALISLVKTINAAITFENTTHLYELNAFTHYLVVYDKTYEYCAWVKVKTQTCNF